MRKILRISTLSLIGTLVSASPKGPRSKFSVESICGPLLGSEPIKISPFQFLEFLDQQILIDAAGFIQLSKPTILEDSNYLIPHNGSSIVLSGESRAGDLLRSFSEREKEKIKEQLSTALRVADTVVRINLSAP